MNIIKLNATQSTNSYLAALVKNNELLDETIVVTDCQTKGRGQRDAVWQSQPSKSLTFSVFKKIERLSSRHQFLISMAVAIAITNYLTRIMTSDIRIKWPNDIMAEGKKCGGILIENQVRGIAINSTIVGVGLNVNEDFFNNLPQATSLKIVSRKEYNLEIVLKGLVSEIFLVLNQVTTQTTTALKFKYEQLLFKKEITSQYRQPDGKIIMGTIKGVNDFGQLLMDLPDGRCLKFWNKEIEMLY